MLKILARMLLRVLLFFYLPLSALLTALNFPYDTDPSFRGAPLTTGNEATQFYNNVYSPAKPGTDGPEGDYEQVEKVSAEHYGIKAAVQEFVETYNLKDRKILEVGSGTGSLQDLVSDYTGLDISRTVAGHYHKPFVSGSATSMPFPDGFFDAIWSIWVLEHVPEPERMLMEMRRVLKPKGLIYLRPAWHCSPAAAQGYEVRPYSDFDIGGKFYKFTLPIRQTAFALSILPIRYIRLSQYRLKKDATRLRYRALTPNYEKYWVPDSDAAVSIDSFEVYLWFRSRGDRCLNCSDDLIQATKLPEALVLQVKNTDSFQSDAR